MNAFGVPTRVPGNPWQLAIAAMGKPPTSNAPVRSPVRCGALVRPDLRCGHWPKG